MSKKKITRALASFGGQITRYWINIKTFNPSVPSGAEIACATFGGGHKLAVTYRMKEGQ
jgi:hypothetical protein